MYIEVIRALKFKAAARFIEHRKTLVKLADFMIIDILGEDEEYVYSTLFERMIDENRLWSRREDHQYESLTVKAWHDTQRDRVIEQVKEALYKEQAIVKQLSDQKTESKRKEFEVSMHHQQSHEKAKKELRDRIMLSQEEVKEGVQLRPINPQKKPLTLEATYEQNLRAQLAGLQLKG